MLNIANCRGLLCAGTALSPPARCCVPLPPLLPIYIYTHTHTHTHHTHTPHTHTHAQHTHTNTHTTNTGSIFTLCPHARRAPYLPRPRPRPVRDPPRPGTCAGSSRQLDERARQSSIIPVLNCHCPQFMWFPMWFSKATVTRPAPPATRRRPAGPEPQRSFFFYLLLLFVRHKQDGANMRKKGQLSLSI